MHHKIKSLRWSPLIFRTPVLGESRVNYKLLWHAASSHRVPHRVARSYRRLRQSNLHRASHGGSNDPTESSTVDRLIRLCKTTKSSTPLSLSGLCQHSRLWTWCSATYRCPILSSALTRSATFLLARNISRIAGCSTCKAE